eukprot:512329-Pleurochrysis_carterae.AAC.2
MTACNVEERTLNAGLKKPVSAGSNTQIRTELQRSTKHLQQLSWARLKRLEKSSAQIGRAWRFRGGVPLRRTRGSASRRRAARPW